MSSSGPVTDLKVQLDIESAKFRSELSKVTQSIDTVSGKLQRIGDKVGGSASNVLKGVAAWNVLGTALEAVGRFVAHGVQQYSEAEQASLRLSSSLTQLGYNADELLGPLEAQQKKFEKLTLFTSEQAAQVQQLLLAYGVAPSEIEKTTAAILDYSAATGSDAAGATDTLMKAVNAGKNGVEGLGLRYVSTGSQAKDLGIAVDMLSGKFNGSAKAAAGGLTGTLDNLTNSFDNLAESFGGLVAQLEKNTGLLAFATAQLEGYAMRFENIDRAKESSAIAKMADEAVRLNEELKDTERLLNQVANDREAGVDVSKQIYTMRNGGQLNEQGLLRQQDRLIKQLDEATAAAIKGVKGSFSGNSTKIKTGVSKTAKDANKPAGGGKVEDGRPALFAAFAKISDELTDEGKKLAESLRTPLEVLNESTAHFGDLLATGAISQETYDRAVADATKTYEKAVEPTGNLADAFAKIGDELQKEGDQITESLRTPLEAFNAEIDKLSSLRDTGHITDETFKRGSAKAQKTLDENKIPSELDKLGNALAAAGQSFLGQLGAVGDIISAGIEGAKEGGAVGAVLAAFMEVMKQTESAMHFMNVALAFVEKLAGFVEPLVAPIFNALKGLLGGILVSIQPLFASLQPLFDAVEKLLQSLSPVLGSIGYLLESLAPIIEIVGKLVGLLFDALKPVFELIAVTIKAIATVILGVLITLNEIAGALGDKNAKAEAARLKALVASMWQPGADAVNAANQEAASNTLENAAAQKEAAKAANEAASALYNLPSGYKIEAARFAASTAVSSMSVPAFADGGVVSKATLAMVGEGGEPELIAPESLLRKVMREEGGRGGGRVNVQIVSNDAEAIWKKIKRLMERDRFNMTGEIARAF